MNSNENGKTVLVTGATSGIGRAIAEKLADGGHRVFICARNAEDVSSTVKQLRACGHQVDGTEGDIRSRESVERVVAAAVRSFGPISVLVNNAGRSGGGPLGTVPDELWYDVIDTNLNGTFLMTREVLNNGGLANNVGGRIISIASTGGKQGVPEGAPYSASKGGIIALTKALAKELAKTGVTVNAVCPGYVETPMAQRVRKINAKNWDMTEDEVLTMFNAKIPIGRYTTPVEVAGLVDYLVSDAASSITAQALNVCGGLGIF